MIIENDTDYEVLLQVVDDLMVLKKLNERQEIILNHLVAEIGKYEELRFPMGN